MQKKSEITNGETTSYDRCCIWVEACCALLFLWRRLSFWQFYLHFVAPDETEMDDEEDEDEGEYPTWKKREKQDLSCWLKHLSLSKYENILRENGYDDINFIGCDILDDKEMALMGIQDHDHRQVLMDALNKKGTCNGTH